MPHRWQSLSNLDKHGQIIFVKICLLFKEEHKNMVQSCLFRHILSLCLCQNTTRHLTTFGRALLAVFNFIQFFAQLLVLLLGFLQAAPEVTNLLLCFRFDVISNDHSGLQIRLKLTPLCRLFLNIYKHANTRTDEV